MPIVVHWVSLPTTRITRPSVDVGGLCSDVRGTKEQADQRPKMKTELNMKSELKMKTEIEDRRASAAVWIPHELKYEHLMFCCI